MENKKTGIIIASVAVILFAVVAFFVMYNSSKEGTKQVQVSSQESVMTEWAKEQNRFVQDFACGITEFDSPYVKPVQCDSEKMQKGVPITMSITGSAVDEDGLGIADVKIVVNNGEPFYTDERGFFEAQITVDSNKKAINLVADKLGYSPVRTVYNAQMPKEGGNSFELPEVYNTNILMRKADIQQVKLNPDAKTIVASTQYPGTSLEIPARALVNSKGEVVSGEVLIEFTYLDPLNNPEDLLLTPGYSGNDRRMIAVDRNGEQLVLSSGGMTFVRIISKETNETLQPKKDAKVLLIQPNTEIVTASATLTEDDLKDLNVADEFKEAMLADAVGKNSWWVYWYYNSKTGIWEDWTVDGGPIIDVQNGINITVIPKFIE